MSEKPFKTLYPGYDVLAKRDTVSWNKQTRAVITRRLTQVPSRQFFDELQWKTLEAVCDRAMPQPDRGPNERVPIAPWLDAKLHHGQTSGTRYEPLPPQAECWRRGIDAIEAEAQHRYRRSFHVLDPVEQDIILRAMDDGTTQSPAWGSRLPSKLFLRHVLLREIVEVYYAHPAAWSEIGFGGPASPRGYVRMGFNRRDSWEGEERAPDAVRAALLR